MAKYKCKTNVHKTLIKGKVYNDSYNIRVNSITTIQDLVNWFPHNWQLVEEFVLPKAWYVVVTESTKNVLSLWRFGKSFPSSKLSPGNITGMYEGVSKEWDDSVEDAGCYGEEITYNQFIKYVLKEDNMKQEIIGYKLKSDCEKYKKAALNISNTSVNWENSLEEYDINSTQLAYLARLERAGVLDLWFEPVYKDQYTLHKINGYDGRVDGSDIKYGCANFNIYKLKDLYATRELSGCRNIKSITLSSDVTITIKEIKQIIDYYDNM